MYTIDLLKGKGLPEKSGPERIIAGVVGLGVPMVIVIIMFSLYVSNRITISVCENEILNYKKKIQEFSDAVEIQKAFERKTDYINDCIVETASLLGRYNQWSPVLEEVVKNMPDLVMFDSLEVKNRQIRKKVPKKDDPKKEDEVTIPARTLRLTVSGDPHTRFDRAISEYMESLRFSAFLGKQLEDIKIPRKFDTFEDSQVVTCEIDCVFKPAM